MSMGNYMGVPTQRLDTMAAKTPTVGIDHTTVTPTNFDPEADSEPEDETEPKQ